MNLVFHISECDYKMELNNVYNHCMCSYVSEVAEGPEPSENNAGPIDPETASQNTLEQGSEKGYESDSESELSFGKTKPAEADMSMDRLLGTIDSWSGAGTSASREGSLDGEKAETSVIPEDEDSLNESSASKSGIDSSANPEAPDEVDGRGRRDAKKLKSFWKDSDGGEEISSDSESVPASFSNPIHGTFIVFYGLVEDVPVLKMHLSVRCFFSDDTSFDSVAPVATQIIDDQNVPLEIVEPSVHSLDMDTAEVSVVCGGTKEGWTPVGAVVLWTRMLGVLGNVNDIESASIHAQVLDALAELWHLLAKVYHTTPYHTIPYRTVPYHTIPYHTIPYHTIPYHTIP